MTSMTKGESVGRMSYEIDGYSHGNNPIPAVARIANTIMTGGISGIDLASGKMLLADRYVGSNLAHQGARVPLEKRTDFLQWLRHLEYQVYALPAEDLVIYLRVPPAEAHRLIGEKAARNYTKLQRDIHESNLAHLAATSEVYDQLAHQPNWLKIECYDASADALRSAESIHQEILAVAQAHATPTLRANK